MQNKKQEIIFFDRFIDRGYDVFTERGYNKILSEFKALVKPLQGEVTIDFGCGTGAFTEKLRRFGLNTTGVDISQGCIEYARKNYPNSEFIVGDCEKTNIKRDSVDIVIFSGLLHHFQDFSDALREAYRILKKGGRVFSYDPNKKNPIMWLYRCKNSPFHSTKGTTDNERLLTSKEIHQVFRKEGFKDVIVYATSDIGYKYVESNLIKFVLPLYNFVDRIADKTIFAKKYGSFLIAKGKK